MNSQNSQLLSDFCSLANQQRLLDMAARAGLQLHHFDIVFNSYAGDLSRRLMYDHAGTYGRGRRLDVGPYNAELLQLLAAEASRDNLCAAPEPPQPASLRAHTGVYAQPQSLLSDRDTRMLDDPALYFETSGNWQSRARAIGAAEQVRFKRVNKAPVPQLAKSTDVILGQWRYPARAPAIRDDPRGEYGRESVLPDRYSESGREAAEWGVGSASYGVGCGGASHARSGAYRPHGAADETYDNTVGFAKQGIAWSPVDELLNTNKIQTMNQVEGQPELAHAVLSMADHNKHLRPATYGLEPFDNGSFAAAHNTKGGPKFWTDGEGPVDNTNAAAMKRLTSRRVFRSFTDPFAKPGPYPRGHSAADQIPYYERALYKRQLDRQTELGGFELGGQVRGYAQSSYAAGDFARYNGTLRGRGCSASMSQ